MIHLGKHSSCKLVFFFTRLDHCWSAFGGRIERLFTGRKFIVLPAPETSNRLKSQIDCHPVQPASDVKFGGWIRVPLVKAKEGLQREILGLRRIADKAYQVPVDRRPVLREYQVKRISP